MNFKKLEIWKRSFELCIEIFNSTKNLSDFTFKDQIGKSALSIPSNIAEGGERGSIKDAIKFLYYARASCAELNTQIEIGMRIKYLDQTNGEKWLQETKELSAMISGLIKSKKLKLNPNHK